MLNSILSWFLAAVIAVGTWHVALSLREAFQKIDSPFEKVVRGLAN